MLGLRWSSISFDISINASCRSSRDHHRKIIGTGEDMGAVKKADGMKPKVAGKGSSFRRDAPAKNVERKKRRPADSFHGPLAQEGGEAEDDFGGVAVLDLAEEAALLAEGGRAQAEFLTGLPGERGEKGQSAEPQKEKKRKKDHSDGSLVPPPESQRGLESAALKKSKKRRKESVASDDAVVEKHTASTQGGKGSSELPKENPRALPLPEAGADRTEQADWFGGCFRAHFGGALSSLEQAELTGAAQATAGHGEGLWWTALIVL